MDRFYKQILKHPLLSSLILNALFLCLAIVFCDPKYETSDDHIVDAILSGAFTGEYDPHLLFSNIIWGYFLVLLYNLIPNISFYFVSLVAAGFISSTVIAFLTIKRNNNWIGILLAIVFLSFYSNDLFILIQFTKTAGTAVLAGALLLLNGMFAEKDKRSVILHCLSGTILALAGTMIRFDAFYVVIPFILLLFIILAVVNIKNKKINMKHFMIRLVSCLLLVGAAFALNYANNILWDLDPDYKEFRELNSYRYPITDKLLTFYVGGIDSTADTFAPLGLEYVDVAMLHWQFLDRDVYTPELLSKISEVNSENTEHITHSPEYIIDSFLDRGYIQCISAMAVILFALIMAFTYRGSVPIAVSSVILAVCHILFVIFNGKIVYRVEFGILISAAAVIITNLQEMTALRDGNKTSGFIPLMAILCLGCTLIYSTSTYAADRSYLTMSADEYQSHCSDIMNTTEYYDRQAYRFDVSHRQPDKEFLDYVNSDDQHYYLIDFHTSIQQLYLNYKPWIRPDKFMFRDGYMYLGGCTMMQYPGQSYVFQYNGIDPVNPYRSLINDNVYVADNGYQDIKLEYIRRHYYPNAQVELVDTVGGYSIWRYFIPDDQME
ncbi:MAG: hypothetical protein J6Z43_00205 [Clostridiales bacterium]|nr:hypothetical protein [Clostridiales bacterium]